MAFSVFLEEHLFPNRAVPQTILEESGVVSPSTSTVNSVDFNVPTALQNNLAVTVVQQFESGTVIATVSLKATAQPFLTTLAKSRNLIFLKPMDQVRKFSAMYSYAGCAYL
ncbi:MAG: hypothetical protein AB8B97_02030 [Granulosicoccus sp.]